MGETVNIFRLCWNNYKQQKVSKREVCMQQYLFQHFGSEDHSNFLNEVEIIFTETADLKDPNK